MANSMPKITIAFKAAAESFVARSSRGTVAVILRDTIAAAAEKHAELRSAAEITTDAALTGLSAANKTTLEQAFVGSTEGRVRRVLVYVLAATATDYTTAYAWLATQLFDWLVLPDGADSTQIDAMHTWLTAQRTSNGALYKCVIPATIDQTTEDDPAIVQFVTGGIKVGNATYTAAQFCARIAGVLASTPVTRSVTYMPLPEVEDVTRLTATAMDAAVAAGYLLAFWDGQQVRLGTGVTSLVQLDQTTVRYSEAQKKILIQECRDLIVEDLRALCAQYIGAIKNTYDGRLTVLTAVTGYLQSLETQTVVQPGWTAALDVDATRNYLEAAGIDTSEMSDDEILAYDYGTSMFIRVEAKLLDAIENITITIVG